MMELSHPLLKVERCVDEDLNPIDEAMVRESFMLRRPTWISRLFYSPLALHLLFAVGYTIFLIWFVRLRPNTGCDHRDVIYSPARKALEYERQVFHSPVDENPFAGPPRPELDAAWHNLLKNIHIKISKEEMEKFGGRSLELTDGSGYAGSLEVYHSLHCLKRIRHFIYRETYLPNLTQAELEKHTFHTEHCLEHLRELVMCRGDIALTTFLYRGGKMTAKLLAEHECVNWNRLENWVSDRVIDLSIPGIVLPVEQSEQFEKLEISLI